MTITNDNAYYYEICILRLLSKMGYLNETELHDIAEIAAEDYDTGLVLDKSLMCPN